ncbi:MAG: dihydrofolate reductase family protein [Anaerolineae bacterium]|nr:dihydrofolate reductase family protein [Anaerolineae bacterium]
MLNEQALGFEDNPYPNQEIIVISRRKELKLLPNARLWPEITIEKINQLREGEGKDIWLVGGGEIIQPFIELNVIDRLVVSICPTLLGRGLPLFLPNTVESRLKFLSSQTFDSGLVMLTYDYLR